MEELDYWRLCEELNIAQAALLVVGESAADAVYVEGWETRERPAGYEAAKTAICTALKNYVAYTEEIPRDYIENFDGDWVSVNQDHCGSLQNRSIEGNLIPEDDFDSDGNCIGYIKGSIELYRSTVKVDSLKSWLAHRGFTTGFFFPDPVETADFLEPSNPRYAPKLAAAVRAWQAVTEAGKRSPKQALDKWLRENASQFGLTNEEGKPVEQAIEECSKVANWNAKGGATKTPS